MPDPLHLQCKLRHGAFDLDVEVTFTAPWTVIFGPSGSGKSTVLRALAGLTGPAHVTLGNEDLSKVPAHRRRITLVAQQPALFPHLSIEQNVRYAASSGGDALVKYRLEHVAAKMPRQISGGERQRAALARAMGALPRVLLLDEVFTGMQAALRTEMMDRLREEQQATPFQIISVTHDVAEAFNCADEVLKIEAGRITAQGPPAEVLATERADLLQTLR